jgi:N-acyl-D-aspartate/D-glutamate deacylase
MRRPISWESILTGYDSLDGYGSAPAGTALETLRRSAAIGNNLWPQVSCRAVVMQVTLADPYPLIAYSWAFKEITALPHEDRAALYRDAQWRERARADLGARAGVMWRRISVQETECHGDIVGVSVADLAAQRAVDPLDLLIDLGLQEGLNTRFRMVLMNDDEDELEQILEHDQIVLGGSDAGAHLSQICDACYSSHLLGHWVREKKTLTLERAVRLLTGHTADVYGLAGRGFIREGYIADLVAFDADRIGVEDLERVRDLPGGADRLIARSRGVEHVWVNGTPIRAHGEDLPFAYPGQLIRSGRP